MKPEAKVGNIIEREWREWSVAQLVKEGFEMLTLDESCERVCEPRFVQ